MTAINLDAVTFSWEHEPERRILDNLSLEIATGSFLGIVGPNGAGKSTLLRLLTGRMKPVSGTALFDGVPVMSLHPREFARSVAVVPQDSEGNFPWLVRDVVLMGRMPHQGRLDRNSDEDRQIARRAMEMTGIWDLRDKSVLAISGGERQRVTIARALAQQPKILLMDEPTSHLDIAHQIALLQLVRKQVDAQEIGAAAILHDFNLAAWFCDRILLFAGDVSAYGTAEEVLTPENIRRAFGIETVSSPNYLTGRFNIIPVAIADKSGGQRQSKGRVHLICGGGSGEYLMERLDQEGFQVSCGVLNIGDTDWNKAKSLGINVAQEAPYAPVGEIAAQHNNSLIAQAQIVVVLPVAFGHGNLSNLKQVEEACLVGKHVILVRPDLINECDFTQGKATEIMGRLLAGNENVVVADTTEVVDCCLFFL